MFAIVYEKSTNKIAHYRHDYSVPQTLTADDCFAQFITGGSLNAQDYSVVQLPYDESLRIIVGNHVYNEATGQIETDPNYVEPVPVEVPAPAPTV